jgi:hypothetical protein
MATEFLAKARSACVAVNCETLYWILSRPPLGVGLLNTKLNSLTLLDYGSEDGVRGPDYVYGWVQGRGLEALARHAAFFDRERPPLAQKLDAAGGLLYSTLASLQQTDGHAYFCYDAAGKSVYADAQQAIWSQNVADDIYTYSDAYVANGLLAGSARYGLGTLATHLAYFQRIIDAVEQGRFQMDERRPLSARSVSEQVDDFESRMTLLGAAGLLKRLGLAAYASYAERFIDYVLTRHFDPDSGLLRNVPGEDSCNVGNGIEFVGFALDYLGPEADPSLVETLRMILLSSFTAGFVGPGIALSTSIERGTATNVVCPWWSLPETIRAAALVYEITGDRQVLDVWKKAQQAFFRNYWRGSPPIAYQTMTKDGPVDLVPGTPDLDPAYHTGLCLLAAIEVVDRLGAAPSQLE